MTKENQNKPKAIYEPGELERTRKNLGEISQEEAIKLTKILGGEIGVEKTPLYDDPKIKKTRTYAHRGDKIKTIQKNVSTTTVQNTKERETSIASREVTFKLPNITSKEKSLMDKLMISNEYRIKNQYGFFTYLFLLAKGNTDILANHFIEVTLNNHLQHLQIFSKSIKKLIDASSDIYKISINQEEQTYFKILRFFNNWNLTEIKDLYYSLEKKSNDVNILAMVPFIKKIYRLLLPAYFFGETNLTELFKTAYNEISATSTVAKETLLKYAQNTASEWLYINGQIIKGLYPLLMRMCSSEFCDYNTFFTRKISNILKFLELTKYDLFLPEKIKPNISKQHFVKVEDSENTENEKMAENLQDEAKKESANAIVKRGLELLDKMFPHSGWLKLEQHPDMYPYFQPIYNFKDGFNLISPENPLQVTIILLRIIEDFFQGCRNIRFSIDKEPDFASYNDNLHEIFSEWSLYRESLFDKTYSSELKDYVNHLDTQSDFARSPYAKKKLCILQWQAKFSFLPNLSFELVFMEKPNNDSGYIPLPKRTKYLQQIFSTLISRIDDYLAAKTEPITEGEDFPDFGATNIMDHYRFDVPNSVSKRLHYFLGSKKSRHSTNLNLLKYALCVISVLHWWINDESSPAYSTPNSLPFRTGPNGKPIFSVPLIETSNEMFLKTIKQNLKAKASVANTNNQTK